MIWNGPPLSNYTRVNQTWIDGRKYFDRAEDAEARKNAATQREALVQKALTERVKDLGKPKEGDDKKPDDKETKTPPGHSHRAHELAGLYGDGRDKHTCTEDEGEL